MATFSLDEFMRLVREANPDFEKWRVGGLGQSSLRPLINVLSDKSSPPTRVKEELAKIPPEKVNQYKDPLYYLIGTWENTGTLSGTDIRFPALENAEAGRFWKTALPTNYNPARQKSNTSPKEDLSKLSEAARLELALLDQGRGDRIVPHCAHLYMTVEQFLLTHGGRAGVLMIHMEKPDKIGLEMKFNGHTCLNHIQSVLRVAALKECDLCILNQCGPKLTEKLERQLSSYGGEKKTTVIVPKGHMGGRDAQFRNFMQSHEEVVVIGFDANVCVDANLFGSIEFMKEGNVLRFIPPVITQTDVVTSRAILVSPGKISPPTNKGQWRWMNNT